MINKKAKKRITRRNLFFKFNMIVQGKGYAHKFLENYPEYKNVFKFRKKFKEKKILNKTK